MRGFVRGITNLLMLRRERVQHASLEARSATVQCSASPQQQSARLRGGGLWLAILSVPSYFRKIPIGKEGCAVTTFFRHYRQRGPVDALQMRLQG
jgi:hypothetical protein